MNTFWKNYARAIYGKIATEAGHSSFEPFLITTCEFAWRQGIQKYFIEGVQKWNNTSCTKQHEALVAFLVRVCKINPRYLNQRDFTLRNKIIREINQRIWTIYKKRRMKYKKSYRDYLLESGLGRYLKTMKKAGLEF